MNKRFADVKPGEIFSVMSGVSREETYYARTDHPTICINLKTWAACQPILDVTRGVTTKPYPASYYMTLGGFNATHTGKRKAA